VWPDLAMYDLNEFFSGEVSLDEFVVGHHFDALAQDFCSDFDIYEAEKSNLNFPGDPLHVNPKEDIFDAEILLQTLEEDGPSLGPEYHSVVEIGTTETRATVKMFDVHSKPECVASADAKDESIGADCMENTGCFGGRRVELSASRIPSFRTVPAMSKEGIGCVPLMPEHRRANFSSEPVRLGLEVQSVIMDSQACQIEEKVFKLRPLLRTDRRQQSCADTCNSSMGSADRSYPDLALQEGQPEWKLRKLEQLRTFSVKGRRHVLSVLKPIEERVKVEVKEHFKLERTVLVVKEPASGELRKNWQVIHGQDHLASTIVRSKIPQVQGAAKHLERRWLETPRKMQLFPSKRRGLKGQSSRERGMNRAAMDERNMRERFWRLRERASVIRLNDLLPEDKKSEKVCLGAVLKGAHQLSLELLDQEQKLLTTIKAEKNLQTFLSRRLCLLQAGVQLI